MCTKKCFCKFHWNLLFNPSIVRIAVIEVSIIEDFVYILKIRRESPLGRWAGCGVGILCTPVLSQNVNLVTLRAIPSKSLSWLGIKHACRCLQLALNVVVVKTLKSTHFFLKFQKNCFWLKMCLALKLAAWPARSLTIDSGVFLERISLVLIN